MKIVFKRKITEEVGRKITKALEVSGSLVSSQAKALCPVDTGNLRSSITHTVVKKDNLNQFAIIGTNVEYAARIEFGFAGFDELGRFYDQAAQPYLRPALELKRKDIIEIFKKVVDLSSKEIPDSNEIINLNNG